MLFQNGKFVDEEFARWCSDHNCKWNDSNFFQSDNVGTLSNCPVSPDTLVTFISGNNNRSYKTTIESLYWRIKYGEESKHVKMLSPNGLIDVRINEFESPIEYKITLENGLTLETTAEHLNKTQSSEYVKTKDLTENDKFLVAAYITNDMKATYKWVGIEKIEKVSGSPISYCVEVIGDHEPVFVLGNGIVTHNCRLLSDTTKLDAFINSIGGTALSIGSIKVNTINLVRIAYETECNEKKYLQRLRKMTNLCCKTLDVVRHIIQRNIEKGLLPNYCDGGIEISKQYATVGILGLFEVIEAFGYTRRDEFGNIYYTDEGIEFADKIFKVLNDVKDNFTKDYSFNIESVPAERAAVILCQKDNLLFEKDEKFIYSNQWIPLSEKCTIQEKLRLSSILDAKCSGGAIAHINLESNFPNTESAWKMLNYIANKGVFYFAFNTRLNECENHHGFVGADICPHCGGKVIDTYQRIVGFLQATRTYSKDRKREFDTRKWYEYADMKGEI